jgi:hypothetical protein
VHRASCLPPEIACSIAVQVLSPLLSTPVSLPVSFS